MCILHEYMQRVLKVRPVYSFFECGECRRPFRPSRRPVSVSASSGIRRCLGLLVSPACWDETGNGGGRPHLPSPPHALRTAPDPHSPPRPLAGGAAALCWFPAPSVPPSALLSEGRKLGSAVVSLLLGLA